MSTPSLDPDDPRLTAYALGEGDEAERQAIEKFLADSVEGRRAVEQTQEFARALTAEYSREHELYLASRPEAKPRSNVVAFQSGRSPSWKRAAVPLLKAAALLAVTASLVYLTLRRPHLPEAVTVASVPTGELARASTPQSAAGRASKDEAVAVPDNAQLDATQASDADMPRAETAAATVPAATPEGSAGDSLAMARLEESDKSSDADASGRASNTFAMTRAAPPVAPSRDASQSIPGAPAHPPPPPASSDFLRLMNGSPRRWSASARRLVLSLVV